jgi:hypothetical protein
MVGGGVRVCRRGRPVSHAAVLAGLLELLASAELAFQPAGM